MAEHALDGEVGLAGIGGPEHGGDAGAAGAGVASSRRGEGNRHHVSGKAEKAFCAGPYPPLLYHNAAGRAHPRRRWNESGTNRARIADSIAVKVRSRQYVAVWRAVPTISGNKARRRPILAFVR